MGLVHSEGEGWDGGIWGTAVKIKDWGHTTLRSGCTGLSNIIGGLIPESQMNGS